jgi:hypothetical protein
MAEASRSPHSIAPHRRPPSSQKVKPTTWVATTPPAPSTSHSQPKVLAMTKIPHAGGRDKTATKHDPANWYCNCECCRCEINRLFDHDRAFFDANPDRRLYCREFIEGELSPEAVEGLPAGYRPVTVSFLCRPGANQVRLRSVYGWPLLMLCPNNSDRAIIAAFGHLSAHGRIWRAGTKQ